MSAIGTKRTSRPNRLMFAIGGKADIETKARCPLLTQSGHFDQGFWPCHRSLTPSYVVVATPMV